MILRATTFLYLPLAAVMLLQGGSCKSTDRQGNASTTQTTVANNQASPTSMTPSQRGRALPPGTWGGQHISLEVTDAGAEINYDCAHGRIAEKIIPDGNGNFEVKGVHAREHPGPVREDEDNEQPAVYRGSINGDTMTLTVTLTQKNESVGTFELTRGASGKVFKCL